MTDSTDHNTGPENAAGYETRDLSLRMTVVVSVAVILLIVVFLVILWEYFNMAKERQIYESVLQPESTVLRDIRARESELLNSYGIVDSTAGVYRIPISRAMKLVAQESYRERQD